MSFFVRRGQWLDRTTALLLLLTSLLAAFLSVVGIIAASSQETQKKRREIAVRKAHGGTRARIGRQMLVPWALLGLVGAVFGIVAHLAVLEPELLAKMEAAEPLGSGALAVAILVVAAVTLAAAIPLVRALRAKPSADLRAP